MSYSIEIAPSARREWKKLDHDIKRQLVKKLETLLDNPRIPSAKLSDMPDCYRIKARNRGYRLIYQVIDRRLVILVLSAAKRERGEAYDLARERLGRP